MNKKQYEVAQDIVVFSKYFAEEVNKIMKNSGLSEEGYRLQIQASNPFEGIDATYDCFIELEIRDIEAKDRLSKAFRRWRNVNGEWENRGDGIIDGLESKDKAKEAVPSGTEKAEKPYPPDGLWIGLDYADPHVDGGM